jgi:hypothetical protein
MHGDLSDLLWHPSIEGIPDKRGVEHFQRLT